MLVKGAHGLDNVYFIWIVSYTAIIIRIASMCVNGAFILSKILEHPSDKKLYFGEKRLLCFKPNTYPGITCGDVYT